MSSMPSPPPPPSAASPMFEYLEKKKTPATSRKSTDVDIGAKKKAFLDEPAELDQKPDNEREMVGFYEETEKREERRWSAIKQMSKYNPLVPLGALVTAGVLVSGIQAMRTNDKAKSQRMMRYRVTAQGFTVVALVIGTFVTQMFAPNDDKTSTENNAAAAARLPLAPPTPASKAN